MLYVTLIQIINVLVMFDSVEQQCKTVNKETFLADFNIDHLNITETK